MDKPTMRQWITAILLLIAVIGLLAMAAVLFWR